MTPCIGYFFYYCDQVPNKKVLNRKGCVSVLTVSRDRAHHVQEGMSAGTWGSYSHFIHRKQRESRKLGKVINLKTSPHWVTSFARFHVLKVPQPFQRASPTGSQPGTLHLYLLPDCSIPWARSSSRWGGTEVWGPLGRVEDKLPYIHCFL